MRWYKIDKDYFREKEEKKGRDSVFKGRVRVVDRCAYDAACLLACLLCLLTVGSN